MITETDHREVPSDLLEASPFVRRIHELKSAATVRACVPMRRILRAPKAACPGILMYHRVVPFAGDDGPTWNVTPECFRDQLSGLLDDGYQPWQLSRLVEASRNGQRIPDNVFVVTFDDGYANNFLYALPVLEELNVPATIFLATGYIGSYQPLPFDDWSQKGNLGARRDTWRALTLAECVRMLQSDMIEFGSHTHTHEDFRNRPDAFRENLTRSIEFLEQEFGIRNPTLSLPYGILSEGFAGPTYFEAAKDLGASCCLTTEEEVVCTEESPFGWGRFIAEQHDTAETLAVKLDGWRDAARDQWRRVRGR